VDVSLQASWIIVSAVFELILFNVSRWFGPEFMASDQVTSSKDKKLATWVSDNKVELSVHTSEVEFPAT
jgi:hypothetical protein